MTSPFVPVFLAPFFKRKKHVQTSRKDAGTQISHHPVLIRKVSLARGLRHLKKYSRLERDAVKIRPNFPKQYQITSNPSAFALNEKVTPSGG